MENATPERGSTLRFLPWVIGALFGGAYLIRDLPFTHGNRALSTIVSVLVDGPVMIVVVLAVILALIFHVTRGERRVVLPVLALIVVVGAVLRFTLSPQTTLDAWPYVRFHQAFRWIWNSFTLQAASDLTGTTFRRVDIALHNTLIFAILTPLPVFLHARFLLGSSRAGLLASFTLALLPHHIQFSHSETAFIPSLAMTSALFALVHVAIHEKSAVWRSVTTVTVFFVAFAAFGARPLNILFYPILIAAIVLLFRGTSLWRRASMAGILTAAFAYTIVTLIVRSHSHDVQAGLTTETVIRGLEAFVSPVHNTLLNPWITPPGLAAIAVLGVGACWFGHRWRLGLFLVGWFMSFFIAHGYVVPPVVAMGARYHLHLVMPFLLMIAVGADWLWSRWRMAGVAFVLFMCAAPWLNRDFIGFIDFSDQKEWEMVLAAAEEIPDGCTIMEFAVPDHPRFVYAGTVREPGTGYRERFRVERVNLPQDHEGPPTLRPVEELRGIVAREAPSCLMYFESLLCWGYKEPGEGMNRACRGMHDLFTLEPVEQLTFEHSMYNDHNPPGVVHGEPVTLTLYRVPPQ
jgi:hypothetical protein